MNKKCNSIILLCALTLGSCGDKNDEEVISQNYVHKYGYALSKKEWESKKYPGQVVTTRKDGVTITSTYENGVLQGPYTVTYPHSQTIEKYKLYNQGIILKEIDYDQKGMPQEEKIFLSPSRYSLTLWYRDGTPKSIEEFSSKELIDGQYFTTSNETEARVIKGKGKRIDRDIDGLLKAVEEYESGYPTKIETFHANGTPSMICSYTDGELDGEKRTFNLNGEPLSLELWQTGFLNGVATYFKNGCKYREIPFNHGVKQGKENYYVDGIIVSHDVLWENNKKHGPSYYYVDGVAHPEWYYEGRKVSEKEYKELDHLDQVFSEIASANYRIDNEE